MRSLFKQFTSKEKVLEIFNNKKVKICNYLIAKRKGFDMQHKNQQFSDRNIQLARINWCNRHKNWDWTKIIFLDKWKFYCESSRIQIGQKREEYLNERKNIMQILIDREDFQDKKS